MKVWLIREGEQTPRDTLCLRCRLCVTKHDGGEYMGVSEFNWLECKKFGWVIGSGGDEPMLESRGQQWVIAPIECESFVEI
jgi:hypothetical protein